MRPLGVISSNIEHATRAGEFLAYAKFLAVKHTLTVGPELDRAIARLLPGVRESLTKAATTASGTDTHAGLLSTLGRAFLESLRTVSVFDAVLAGGARRVPLRTSIAVVSSAIVGAGVAQYSAKPVGSIGFGAADITPRKAAGVVVMTTELYKAASASGGSQLFDTELRNAVAVATDQEFLAALYSGVTPTASAGNTTANVMTDLGALLGALTVGVGSRVYLVASPTNVLKLMLKVTTGGDFAFPNLSLSGGDILPGMSLLASTAVPSGAILAIDAAGIVAGSDAPELRVIRHGDIIMDTAPDSPPTASTIARSLWQQNERALLCERFFGFAKVRSNSVAAISGANY